MSASVSRMDEKRIAQAAKLLTSARRVIVLSGAGMSTAAGIPDFRSPGGLYGTSERLIDSFTYVGDARSAARQRAELTQDVRSALLLSFFETNPLPYHEMRRGLIVGLGEGQWKPTLAHILPEILDRRGKLQLLASQNIDGLDHLVIRDKRKLYNPHGLMSTLVSEPLDEPLCASAADPIYQRYVELVKEHIKDIYADRPAREGKSSHLWPGPARSTPITLDMFGELLPERFRAAAARERDRGVYSVKPGSVLFDRCLWDVNAAGEACSAFDAVRGGGCDLVVVMGTSLSGLTIDDVAHMAGRARVPRVVLDLGTAPVEALARTWDEERDVHLQAALDESVLALLRALGWLELLPEFLPQLCLKSLVALQRFAGEHEDLEACAGLEAKVAEAIALEVEREKRFYNDE